VVTVNIIVANDPTERRSARHASTAAGESNLLQFHWQFEVGIAVRQAGTREV